MGEPLWITYDSGSGVPEFTATELRQNFAALFEGAAGQAFSGVKHGTGLVTLAGTTITHAAHNFAIQGITATTGVYVGYEPQATKTLTAAHATLNRVDAVWVRIQDHEADASGQRRSIVEYTAGTAGSGSAGVDGIIGAPAAPATPYVLLATIFVPLNNTAGSVVTDRRTYYNPPPKIEVFTSSGTYTKPANLKYAVFHVQGGGGGGGGAGTTGASQGSCGAGGGGGGYSRKVVLASAIGATETVTVGAGGAGAAAIGGTGSTGGTSSLGAHCSATGGGGGGPVNAVTNGVGSAGAGGAGSSGDLNLTGAAGDTARVSAGEPVPTRGGDSMLGQGGGQGPGTNTSVGVAGTLYGGGGSGGFVRASTTGVLGSAGAAGVVIVESYFA